MSHCYHLTSRCNNREFRLTRLECRQVFLYILKKAILKYNFKLYCICIMSNHIHYLIEPQKTEDIPKIMHYINWYSAMCFNRMLKRTGHFWEKRLGNDGITTWHPAFLALGEDLEECAEKYRHFCHQYKPQEKQGKVFHWGNKLLPKLTRKNQSKSSKNKKQQAEDKDEEAKKQYEIWRENNPEIIEVADKFMLANCYNPHHVGEFLNKYKYY